MSDVLHMLKEELKIAMIVAGWVLSTYQEQDFYDIVSQLRE